MDSETAVAVSKLFEFLACRNPHKPLDPSKREIRLLRVLKGNGIIFQCEVMHASLNNAPHYIALSYTWNDEGASKFFDKVQAEPAVLIDGCKVRITPNLAVALMEILKHNDHVLGMGPGMGDGPFWYWIDALCIDQTNNQERAHQVGQMRDIYAKADHVRIWLGHDEPEHLKRNLELRKAMDRVEDIYAQEYYDGKLQETFYPVIGRWADDRTKQKFMSMLRPVLGDLEVGSAKRQALEALLSRSWWRRVWTVQEIGVSQGGQFFWGIGKGVDYDILLSTIAYFDILNKHIGQQSDRIYLFQYRRMRVAVAHPRRLLELFAIRIAYHCDASDPRDAIYGVLGLAGEHDMGIEPDYSTSVEMVYAKATKAFLGSYRADDPRRLSLLSLATAQLEGRFEKLPSWAPDYRGTVVRLAHYAFGFSDRNKPLQRFWASGRVIQADIVPQLGSDPMILQVAGISIGTVAQVGPAYRTRGEALQMPDAMPGEVSLKQLCADAYVFMNSLIWWMNDDRFSTEKGATVKLVGNSWLDICNMILLGSGEVDAKTLYMANAMLVAGSGLIDIPSEIDPEPKKKSAQPMIIGGGQAMVEYQFRDTGDLGRSLIKVVGTDDPFARRAAIPNPKTTGEDVLRLNLVQLGDTGNTTVTRQAMYPAPWERDSAATFLARLHSTAPALCEFHNRMRDRVVFRSSDGRLGIANDTIRQGDSLYVLIGAEVPFILRKDTKGNRILVCEALMNGIMEGEAVDGRDIEVLELR
jgi:hypothetical protein